MKGKRGLGAGAVLAGVPAAALTLFLLAPIVVLLAHTTPGAVLETVREGEVQRSLAVTLGGAGIATALGLLLGVPLAWLLARRRFAGRNLVNGLLGLPVIIPHTSAGIALLLTFGARGPAGQLFGRLGLFFTDSLAGVVAAMLFISVPFLVNAARDAFAMVDTELELAALCDGASRAQAFWHITLPLAGRGIAGGALLMWARGISEFGAVILLAYHPRTLAVLVYERFQGYGLASATPLAALLILIALLTFGAAAVLLARHDAD